MVDKATASCNYKYDMFQQLSDLLVNLNPIEFSTSTGQLNLVDFSDYTRKLDSYGSIQKLKDFKEDIKNKMMHAKMYSSQTEDGFFS